MSHPITDAIAALKENRYVDFSSRKDAKEAVYALAEELAWHMNQLGITFDDVEKEAHGSDRFYERAGVDATDRRLEIGLTGAITEA